MIAFAGSTEVKYMTEQVAKAKELSLTDLSAKVNNLKAFSDAVLSEDFSVVIIDLESVLVEFDQLVDSLKRLEKASGASFIFVARGYNLDATVIAGLRHYGFKKFVLSSMMGDIKRELSDCLEGVDNVDTLSKKQALQFTKATPEERPRKGRMKIAFAGTQERIGTTTQAISYAKYLQFIGYKVCYIEANHSGHIGEIESLYPLEAEDKALKMVTFNGLDLYSDMFQISKIQGKDYEVYIYDFGVLEEHNRFAFLGSDLKLLVTGSKPWELNTIGTYLSMLKEEDIKYLFSFTDRGIREQLRTDMTGKKEDVFFTEWHPDMFSLSGADKATHEALTKYIYTTPKKQKKKPFWKR